MTKHILGDLILFWRKHSGLSQEELADGIMHVSSLSRIESGESIPTRRNLELLFDKLGISPNSLADMFMTKEMAKYQKITDALDVYLSNGNTTAAGQIITELKADSKFNEDIINTQYLLAAEAANAINMRENPGEIIKLLKTAISTNKKSFDERHIEDYQLTRIDFLILNMLATEYFESGKKDECIAILYGLKHNIEKRCIDKIERGRRYPQTVYHLTKYLSLLGRYKEAIEVCNQGIKVCLETGFLKFLPYINMNKVSSLYGINNKDAAFALLREIYYTLSMYECYDEKEMVKSYAEEKFPDMVL